MGFDIASRPKIDAAVSGRYNWKSSPTTVNSQRPSRSSASSSLSRCHLTSQPRFAVFVMVLLFAMLISNPNYYHLVHSLSIVSPTSIRRPTTNFAIRYDTFQSIQKQTRNIQQLPFSTLLFQSNTDMNDKNDNNESSAAINSSAMDDDTITTATAATPNIDRTSFDDAGRSLLDEEDMKRMNEMGDFDVNPNVCIDNIFWFLLLLYKS